MVFIPLSDDNPLRSVRFQWVTIALIAANVVVFLLENTPDGQAAIASFALVPSELFHVRIWGGTVQAPDQSLQVPEGLTLVTYQFLHGDILHLLSNMLFLWVFGDNVEDAMGHVKFLAFYLLCGIAGGFAHALMLPTSRLPLIGASGAVAGTYRRLSHPASARAGVGAGVPQSFRCASRPPRSSACGWRRSFSWC